MHTMNYHDLYVRCAILLYVTNSRYTEPVQKTIKTK